MPFGNGSGNNNNSGGGVAGVESVNGRTGVVSLTKTDVGLGQVTNVAQAAKVDFDLHIADEKHVTPEEKQKIADAVPVSMLIEELELKMDTADKATTEDIEIGTDDVKFVTVVGAKKIVAKEIVTEVPKEVAKEIAKVDVGVVTVNGRKGAVTLNKTDVSLGNVLDKEQATKEDFNAHKAENTHLSEADRNKLDNMVDAGAVQADLAAHKAENTHLSQADRDKLDNMVDANVVQAALETHERNTIVHVTNSEKNKWNNKMDVISKATDSDVSSPTDNEKFTTPSIVKKMIDTHTTSANVEWSNTGW